MGDEDEGEDEAYAVRLLEILAPRPTGTDPGDPYGAGDDGIDRTGGFGTELRVESVTPVDGPHGAEIEVGFVLDEPAAGGRGRPPRRGVVRMPFDRKWRELSGYADPAAYAPDIAHRLGPLVWPALRTPQEVAEQARWRAERRAALPPREEQWRLLLDLLDTGGRVDQVAPGRIEVHSRRDPSRVLTVILTPEEWEEVILAHTTADSAVDWLSELLASRDRDERYLVLDDGRLERSTRAELPPVRGRAGERRMRATVEQHPGPLTLAAGRWDDPPHGGPRTGNCPAD